MPAPEHITDPIERIVADALYDRGISYVRDGDKSGIDTHGLDFKLMGVDVFIECKQFYTPRIAQQMERVSNVIAIQGKAAAMMFAALLTKE